MLSLVCLNYYIAPLTGRQTEALQQKQIKALEIAVERGAEALRKSKQATAALKAENDSLLCSVSDSKVDNELLRY